jgi:hypothetical protein
MTTSTEVISISDLATRIGCPRGHLAARCRVATWLHHPFSHYTINHHKKKRTTKKKNNIFTGNTSGTQHEYQ